MTIMLALKTTVFLVLDVHIMIYPLNVLLLINVMKHHVMKLKVVFWLILLTDASMMINAMNTHAILILDAFLLKSAVMMEMHVLWTVVML
jgi:hypothetical protein